MGGGGDGGEVVGHIVWGEGGDLVIWVFAFEKDCIVCAAVEFGGGGFGERERGVVEWGGGEREGGGGERESAGGVVERE